ncbi:MAG TPA: hypothetical protein PKA82_08585 [Pyrinomonadaceae bacterium]|nr:hypothetical protein [Pyrinomonadaceae bacterium]
MEKDRWQQRVNEIPPTHTAEFRQCFKCNYEGVTAYPICPSCRSNRFFNESSIRTRGFILIGVGLFLVAFMVVIAAGVFILLAGASQDASSAKKINAQFGMLMVIYAIFAAVAAFGLNAIVGGFWMIIAGRRSRVFVWLLWITLALMFGGGVLFRILT